MGISEKRLRDILGREIQVSETVNQRLQDTYSILEKKHLTFAKQKHYRKNLRIAAVIAAIICLGIPGMVYASVKSGFLLG